MQRALWQAACCRLTAVGLMLAATLILLAARPAAAGAAVGLEVDGRLLQPDVPPVVVEGRTLVPIRTISEELGAQVHFVAETEQVFIERRGVVAVIILGAATALLNGEALPLDVPAQVIDGRAMVPLRFVADAFGATLLWDDASRMVSIWRQPALVTGWTSHTDATGARVRIGLADDVDYSVQVLAEPFRIAVDLMPATLGQVPHSRSWATGLVRHVSLSQTGERGRQVRLLIEPAAPTSYRVRSDADGLLIELDHRVTDLRFGRDGNVPYLFVATTGPVAYTTFTLPEPSRLVIDLQAGPAAGLPPQIDAPFPWAERVRSSHFQSDPDVVRIVLDRLAEPAYEVVRQPEGLLLRFRPTVEGLVWEDAPAGTSRLRIATDLPLAAEVSLREAERRLIVNLPGATLESAAALWAGDDATVERVVLSETPGGAGVVAVLHLPYYLGHELAADTDRPGVTLQLVSSPVYRRSIFIDPGHGGSDPGAIASGGLQEKSVVLRISLLLRDLLQQAGAEVHMSRSRDEDVALAERARLAGVAQAEVFVSVHVNAHRNDEVEGTETYYTSNHPASRALARALQQALLAELGRVDRGVKEAQFVVLREAKMPAALVELAFLSNPVEGDLLADPQFQAAAAAALRQGIFNYFLESLNYSTNN